MSFITLQHRAALTVLYNEPQRHYHNLAHVYDCLLQLELLKNSKHVTNDYGQRTLDYLEAAIWFHDCVYDPKASKHWNEKESARIAYETTHSEVVRDLVLNTTHDHVPETTLGKYLVDIDMSGFAKSFDQVLKNSEDIRKEYAHVPDDVFYPNRSIFLMSVLNKPHIYHSSFFHNLYEEKARDNIKKELKTF
jgi:predicted metal-dependent HD superfamily phosphohydrolase